MLKVAFITPTLYMGGAERWVVTLAKHLTRVQPYAIINLNGRYSQELQGEARSITNVVNCEDYNRIFLINEVCKSVDAIISWGFQNLEAINFKGPIIEVSHGGVGSLEQVEFLKRSSLGATHHVGVSLTSAQAFPNFVIPKVIYNGVEQNKSIAVKSKKQQRQEWGIGEDKKLALFLGRVTPVKNPMLAINASKLLPQDWSMVFIKNGDFDDFYARHRADFDAPNIKLVDRTNHIGDYLNACDVSFLTSRSEGMPLALIESWLHGIPTVTTQYPTYLELESLHGKLSHSIDIDGNEKELVEKLITADMHGRYGDVCMEAKCVAFHNYTAETMARKWEDYLLEICQ